MVKPRFLATLAFCATLFAFGVIALGAFTRLIDAGLGCPDWPGCYGHLMVPLTKAAQQLASLHFPESPLETYKAWAEMIHRYFVGGLSCFILAIILVVIFKQRQRSNLVLAGMLLLLLIYQIMLGRWTITLKLLPIVVTQHLLGGFLIFTVLWLIYLNNNQRLKQRLQVEGANRNLQKLIPFGLFGLLLLLLQMILGAWTSTNYAALSCPDFPFCLNDQPMLSFHWREAFNPFSPPGLNYEGGVLPEAIRQTIQMTHRLGALIVTLYLFLFMAFTVPVLKKIPPLMQSLYVLLGLLCLQLCIGITNVLFKLPLITAMAHNLIAVLLLMAMTTFLFKLVFISREAHRA